MISASLLLKQVASCVHISWVKYTNEGTVSLVLCFAKFHAMNNPIVPSQDEERLRNERVRALKAKERFAQSVSGIGSDSVSLTHALLSLPFFPFYTFVLSVHF